MKIRHVLTLAAGAVAATAMTVSPAAAGHLPADPCEPYGAAGLGVQEVGGVAYVDVRGVDTTHGTSFSIWVYEESNGVADLQRGGESALLGDTDPCVEVDLEAGETPDTLLV